MAGLPRCDLPRRDLMLCGLAGVLGTVTAVAAAATRATSPEPLTAQIDAALWLPMLRAHERHRVDDYIALHSRALVMVSSSERKTWNFAAFEAGARRTFSEAARAGGRIDLALRFTERIVHPNGASERGISRARFPNPDGPPSVDYARFHAIARRERGRWRILSWYDQPGDAAAFEAATPLDQPR